MHAPLPLRDCPGGQTAHGAFRHRTGLLNCTFCTGCGFRNGWKNERELFFSGAAFPLPGDNLEDDACDPAALVPLTCVAEALEARLLAELTDEEELPE